MYRGKVRFRSITNVLDEIKQIIEKYHIKNIHFHDDNFLLNPQRIKELCEFILDQEVKFYWICLATVKVIVENPEILPLMRKAGCVGIEIGVESGDMNVLKTLNKSMDLDDIKIATKHLQKHDIHPMFLLMSYSLGENIETPYKTIMLFYELKYSRPFQQLPVSDELKDSDLAGHLARASPGSIFYNIARDRGVFLAEDWDDHIEEKLNFVPNEFIYDVPIKNRIFDNYNAFYTFITVYRNNIQLYAAQNFYISFPILKEYFSSSIEELIMYMWYLYGNIDGTKSVYELVDIVEDSYKADLTKVIVTMSIMSIFRIIKSKIYTQ